MWRPRTGPERGTRSPATNVCDPCFGAQQSAGKRIRFSPGDIGVDPSTGSPHVRAPHIPDE
ncbi:hypothetical protein PLANTIT3_60157 [Plantibacter sp. T3]|nr:hypothetical protein PLANTIT3_60157 [Plantibacter sp. T3]